MKLFQFTDSFMNCYNIRTFEKVGHKFVDNVMHCAIMAENFMEALDKFNKILIKIIL